MCWILFDQFKRGFTVTALDVKVKLPCN